MKPIQIPSVSEPLKYHRRASNETAVLYRAIAPLIEGKKILLDVGASDGSLASLLSQGRRMIVVEPFPENAAILHQLFSEPEHQVICNRVEDIEIPPNSIDAILFAHSLYYVCDARPIIHRLLGGLKDGGIAIFVLLSRKGDQSDIIHKYWKQYHRGALRPYPSPVELRKILYTLPGSIRTQQVVSYCSIRTRADEANFLAFALDVPFQKLLPRTRRQFREFIISLRPSRRPKRLSTVHEIIIYSAPDGRPPGASISP